MFRTIFALCLLSVVALSSAVMAQAVRPPEGAQTPREATGGAQTLEDILARERGQFVDGSFRSDNIGGNIDATQVAPALGPLGAASDADIWRRLRFDKAQVTLSSDGAALDPASSVTIQDAGMWWLDLRRGPLATYGGYLLLGTLAFLALFLLLRGRIRIDGEKTGRRITRFKAIERFGHWLTAGSFILLGITGLISLFGRMALVPLVGKEAFAPVAQAGKWVHNNVAWAFMLGLVMIFVMWVAQNIPNRHDLKWIAVGGGLFSKNVHPPALKFNAGQKLIFWAVIVLGVSISASGLSLLFPFQLPMFAKTFVILNDTGLPQWLGFGPLPEALTPHQEMQLAQLWHAIVAFVFIAVILAHIYIGSIGMEGAFDAMGSGEVEEQWAREHHGLWLEQRKSGDDPPGATPAE